MKREKIIEAIRHAHPGVSTERCEDLLDAAAILRGPFCTPLECGRDVLNYLENVEAVDALIREGKLAQIAGMLH